MICPITDACGRYAEGLLDEGVWSGLKQRIVDFGAKKNFGSYGMSAKLGLIRDSGSSWREKSSWPGLIRLANVRFSESSRWLRANMHAGP